MREFFKRIRIDYSLSSLITIALGIFSVAHPSFTFSAVGVMVAVILLVMGVILLSSYMFRPEAHGISAFMGAVLMLLGIWILIQPKIVMALIPIILGVLMFWHGIRGMKTAVEAKNFGSEHWWIGFLTSVASVVFGIFFVIDAFGVLDVMGVVFGIGLIFNGISNLICVTDASRSERQYRRDHPIDTEFIEDRHA